MENLVSLTVRRVRCAYDVSAGCATLVRHTAASWASIDLVLNLFLVLLALFPLFFIIIHFFLMQSRAILRVEGL